MGERIGKYRVLARLGQGGMARVLLTMSEGPHGFNKLLVVKELREELAHDPEFLAMFMDEARIAARLNHPNIVQTYEIGNDGERHFIAMEFLEGQPLNAIFRRVGRRHIPLELHLRILADVLAGLQHAHDLADFDGSPFGIVHRDVSPQNVFITYEGVVKLVDFGIAKAAGASSRTQEGILKGKISYIAPEQARCETVDSRADLFAVGLMLWEALSGRRLVQKEDEASVLARRMSGQDPSIRTVVPDVPAELAAICDKAMAPRPQDRFQSAREFQEVIEAYLARSDFRVGPKDVGGVVVHAFADERERIKKAIEQAAKGGSDPIQLELQPPSLKVTSDSLPRVMPPYGTSDHPPPAATGTNLTAALPPSPRQRSYLPALAIGAALAMAALGIVIFLQRGEAQPHAAKGDTAGSASTTPAADTIQLTLHFPQGAKAKLDGGLLDKNPFVAKVSKDTAMHQLEVELEGFETEKRTIMYDKDVELTVELAPVPAASTQPSTQPRAAGGGGRPYRGRGKPTAETAPADPPPTKVEEPEGGKKKPKPSVEIDEQNPYKKNP